MTPDLHDFRLSLGIAREAVADLLYRIDDVCPAAKDALTRVRVLLAAADAVTPTPKRFSERPAPIAGTVYARKVS